MQDDCDGMSTCFFRMKARARRFLSHKLRARLRSRRIDAGKTPINEVLSAMQPRLHLFGHHHVYTVAERQHVPSIGLERVSRFLPRRRRQDPCSPTV